MNLFETVSPALADPTVSQPDPKFAHRLIVLIPADTDARPAMRRILDLAIASGADVLFLGLCKDVHEELSLHRELIALSAFFEDARICAETKLEIGGSWVDIAKSSCRAGDMVVCLLQQRVGLLRRPLKQVLEANLGVPVYVLSDSLPHNSRRPWLSRLVSWVGFLTIILICGVLQLMITQLPGDWLRNVLFLVSTFIEFWLIWVWNRLYD